jgi:hypothetical protein
MDAAVAAGVSLLSGPMMLAEGPDAPPIGVVKVPPMPGVAGFVAPPGEEGLVPTPAPAPGAVPFPVLVPAELADAGYLQVPLPAQVTDAP